MGTVTVNAESEHRWYWGRGPLREDASALVGLQTPAAYALALLSIVVLSTIAFAAGGVTRPWLLGAVLLVLAAVALMVLAAAGDPLRPLPTAVAVLLPPTALAAAVPALTREPGLAYTVLTAAIVSIQVLTAVRGRLGAAWLGLALSIVVGIGADRVAGPLATLTGNLGSNLAVMIMATVFVAIIRPRARRIHALRRDARDRSAIDAAQEAVLTVRDQEVAGLARQARPLLERIATGEPIDDAVVGECLLVEAALRDRIRAPGLHDDDLAAAVWQARARGARVLLLDDRAVGDDDPDRFAPLLASAAELLDSVGPGSEVTVRVLPNGRGRLATITVVDGGRLSRWEFTPDGLPA